MLKQSVLVKYIQKPLACLISLVLLIGAFHWLVIDECRTSTSIKIVQGREDVTSRIEGIMNSNMAVMEGVLSWLIP
jgi:hypothetical protein